MPTNLKLETGRIICNPQTTSSHETAQRAWQIIAKVYKFLFFGLEENVTVEEAKGYTQVALILIVAIVIGGMVEGGAL